MIGNLRVGSLGWVSLPQGSASGQSRDREAICGGALKNGTPRTISSSARRAQSSASRFVRKVFDAVGHPALRHDGLPPSEICFYESRQAYLQLHSVICGTAP